MSILVGFGYRMRSGKDTCVKAIIDTFSDMYDIRRYAFGDELKTEFVEAAKQAGSTWELMAGMRVTHGLPDWVQYDFDAPKDDPICGDWGKHRTLLQWWGTEYRRSQNSLYWVKKLARTIEKDRPQFALITDTRFPNEGAFVKLMGGFTVKVTRQGMPVNDHPSEHMMDDYPWDFELVNEDSVEKAKALAAQWFSWFLSSLTHPPVPKNMPGLTAAQSGEEYAARQIA